MNLDLKNTISSVSGLIVFGWIVAAIRLFLDVNATESAMYFGVYYLMPLAYLYVGITGRLDGITWPRLALTMVVVGFFVWFVPNLITYTTAQFMGWDFGRFAPGRAAPIAEGTVGKLLTGLGLGAGTMLAGTGWSIVFGSLLIYLPNQMRANKNKGE